MIGLLDVQSYYSLLESSLSIDDILLNAKSSNYKFIALADNNLHGMYEFYKRSKELNINSSVGMHVLVERNVKGISFLVYPTNEQGIKELLTLNKRIIDEKVVNVEYLSKFKNLLFIYKETNIYNNENVEDATNQIIYDLKEFNKNFKHFYYGINYNKRLINLEEALIANSIKAIPLYKVRYEEEKDLDLYRILNEINDSNFSLETNTNYAFINKAEFLQLVNNNTLINNLEEAINLIKIDYKYPKFNMPRIYEKEEDNFNLLKHLSYKGLEERINDLNVDRKKYVERLNFELNVINNMGFNNYFLIVHDVVKYAKDKDYLVGPGRGSSGGSLVSYCLEITDVDPIKYDLLFERFLNPERKTMPDIDIDFPDDKRNEVIEYVGKKYGHDHILSITTFGKFALKSSVRDISKTMKLEPNRVLGIIESNLKGTMDKTDKVAEKVLTIAKKIEGVPRYTGTHAAGIIVSNEKVTNYIPVQKGPYSFYQSQYEASVLDEMGLLKIDFLGIRNLNIIEETLNLIGVKKKREYLAKMPLDDKKAFELLAKAETSGIFQLESSGMKNVLKLVKPTEFTDLVDILALFRPGPAQFINTYAERKHGVKFEYLHEDLVDILKSTYGIIIYQEQIMQIASKFANLTFAESDLLRRAIGSKDEQLLLEQKDNFIKKSSINHDKKIGEQIFEYILNFANYGFNKSHSVAYGLVSYQMAYLKANYFLEFMSVLLSNVIGNKSQINEYIEELESKGYEVLSPSVISSTDRFIVKDGKIIMPLNSVFGIGRQTTEDYLKFRKNYKFSDYTTFKSDVKGIFNEKQLITLIFSNALDDFGLNKQTMIENLDHESSGFESYFLDYKLQIKEEYEFSFLEEKEREAIGLNLKYNIKNTLSRINSKIRKIRLPKDTYHVGLYVKEIREINTKNNEQMAFLTCVSEKMTFDVTVFPEVWQKTKHSLAIGSITVMELKKTTYNKKISYVLNALV